jgi:hypothetical protein
MYFLSPTGNGYTPLQKHQGHASNWFNKMRTTYQLATNGSYQGEGYKLSMSYNPRCSQHLLTKQNTDKTITTSASF